MAVCCRNGSCVEEDWHSSQLQGDCISEDNQGRWVKTGRSGVERSKRKKRHTVVDDGNDDDGWDDDDDDDDGGGSGGGGMEPDGSKQYNEPFAKKHKRSVQPCMTFSTAYCSCWQLVLITLTASL